MVANKLNNFYWLIFQINPLEKVPVLIDGRTTICDSHAISIYLCQKSGDQHLYPDDAKIKAKINEMIFFNSGTLFTIDSALYVWNNFYIKT